MDSVYVFNNAPSSVKRLIYLYSIGLGTPTSKLIKEEYDKIYEENKHNIIVNKHMTMYEDKNIGFIGCLMSSKESPNGEYSKDLFKKYYNYITSSEELLLPEQIYEINSAKLFYLYNCSNLVKFSIIFSIYQDNLCLKKLFKYKILKLNSEEK